MTAIRRAMLAAALEQLAVAHLPHHHRGEAFAQRRAAVDVDTLEARGVALATTTTPETELGRARAAAGVQRWLAEQPARWREVATRLVGMGGRPAQAPREIAASMRLPARAVHDARHRLMTAARQDEGLRALWEEIAA